ncbi:MAG: GatB/YqeY domain-containing protein, partial [Bacteriovoracaceae bacterium]
KKLFIENDTSGNPKPELDIVIAHAKKIKDSLSMYPQSSPQREGILEEVIILAEFLPKALEKEEVAKMIEDIKASQDSPNMGSVMKDLSPKIKGKFDGKTASQMVKDALS